MSEEPKNRLFLRIVCVGDYGDGDVVFERKSENRLTTDQVLLMIPEFSKELKKWVSNETENRIEFLDMPSRQSGLEDFREDGHEVDEPECFTLEIQPPLELAEGEGNEDESEIQSDETNAD